MKDISDYICNKIKTQHPQQRTQQKKKKKKKKKTATTESPHENELQQQLPLNFI